MLCVVCCAVSPLQVSAVLEAGVSSCTWVASWCCLAFGTFLVVRQVLVRRDLELAAKELQGRNEEVNKIKSTYRTVNFI